MAALSFSAGAIPAGAAVVTAGRRLARALRSQYAAHACSRGLQVWRTPDILPWQAWIETLWDVALYSGASLPARLHEDQELLLWQRILEHSPEGRELLDLPATAEAARDSWHLMHSWHLDPRAIEAAAAEDARAFLRWARQFEHLSESHGWIEPARRPDHLARHLPQLPLPSSLLLAGFDEFTPQQRRFFAACEAAGARLEILTAAAASPGRAMRLALPDRAREIEAAARWARALLERGEARAVGVVIPDLEASRPEVERIFTRLLQPKALLPGHPHTGLCFDISAAPPLASQPVVRAALLALELNPCRNPITLVSSLLRSSFLAAAHSERAARALLDKQIRESGHVELSLLRLQHICRDARLACPELLQALLSWFDLESSLPHRQTPGGWSRDFSRLLSALGWPGQRTLSSPEYQAAGAFNQLLARLSRLDVVTRELTRSEALGLLRRMAARTTHQPESPPAPIQILGVLEAAGLSFDALWIAGLDDETWPRPPRPDPFLPLSLQCAHRLPRASAQRELEFARLTTLRLLASAPLILASWPLRHQDRDLGPSPLIRHLPEITQTELGLAPSPDFLHLLRAASRIESFQDDRGPALAEGTWSRGGARVFQCQALCPFRAFAEIRLAAAALEFPQPGLSPRDRGLALHAALEHFWGQLQTHRRLLALNHDQLAAALEDAVEAGLKHLEQSRGELPPRFTQLERARLQRLLAAWLELEKKRPPFRVIEREALREVELAGIRACIRIDRIDRLEDHSHLILDYKTGRCSTADWDGPRPADPQLPLYAVSHQGVLAGLAFAQIKTGQICFRGLGLAPQLAPGLKPDDLEARLQQWRTTLQQLGRQFRQGRAEVDPYKGGETCRTCRLSPLCRIHQAELAAADNGAEELL